jgi:hypothetical protein
MSEASLSNGETTMTDARYDLGFARTRCRRYRDQLRCCPCEERQERKSGYQANRDAGCSPDLLDHQQDPRDPDGDRYR